MATIDFRRQPHSQLEAAISPRNRPVDEFAIAVQQIRQRDNFFRR